MITFGHFKAADYDGCCIVTDGLLAELYGVKGDNVYILPRGERAKSFVNVRKLCSFFLSRRLDKGDRVVALGGGSVGDTVGFAASVYKRGVGLLHVPTTLVAQIDSCIGGKTAIDLDGVKNAVGTFYPADALIDVDFLRTLDDKQLTSGRGELLKYRMLCADVDRACDGGADVEQIVRQCVSYKQSVCLADPYDAGERHKLNFGHTVGHALELAYKLPHGVAVGCGIYYETLLARKLGLCAGDYADKWMAQAAQFGRYPLNEALTGALAQDKKNANGRICFVLPSNFNSVYLTEAQVRNLLLQ